MEKQLFFNILRTDVLNELGQIYDNNDLICIGEDAYEEDFPEIELVEIPVVKRIVFQFKGPVKLEFS